MNRMKLLLVLSTTILVGCAYPGHGGLMRDAHQVSYSYSGKMDVLAECLTEKFNNEPFGIWDINTPVTTSLPRGNSIQLVSSVNSMWWWSILLSPTIDGTSVSADIRKFVHPSLAGDYMRDKVDGYMKVCGARQAVKT